MRPFFATSAPVRKVVDVDSPTPGAGVGAAVRTPAARVAVYDDGPAAPRVVDVCSITPGEFIENASDTIYSLAREAGGPLPYTAIREIVENYIHAGFSEPVISILDSGHTIRFADQGPGISDKDRAVLPGFTTATSEMKAHIRGVGSGLPIVREYLSISGGSLKIEDNLGHGAVVTISIAEDRPSPTPSYSGPSHTPAAPNSELPGFAAVNRPTRLSSRQKRVLALVLEQGSVGPSLVSKELDIAVSTAHRDLALLESLGFICSDETGKRTLTDRGITAAEDLLRS